MRPYIILFIAVLLPHVGCADLTKSATLDEVLALATRPELPNKICGYDYERSKALGRLEDWPEVSPQDEARIAAAFTASLRATHTVIRGAGASGLGRRKHSEEISAIFELAEQDTNLIGCFFTSYTLLREVDPPLYELRRGLGSNNPDLRTATMDAIASCKAFALRHELEATLSGSFYIRSHAARALGQLRMRESAPALRRALDSDPENSEVAYAITQLGSDTDIAAVLPLLKSRSKYLRRIVADGLWTAKLDNPRAACDALIEALSDPSNDVEFCDPSDDVRISAMRALGHFREPRAIAPIRKLIAKRTQGNYGDDRTEYVDAICAIGGADAIALLDDMITEFRDICRLELALIRFASPSSARAVWIEYCKDPIRESPGSDTEAVGYIGAISVLAACADAELLRDIQDRWSSTKDTCEKRAFESLVAKIKVRLNKSEP